MSVEPSHDPTVLPSNLPVPTNDGAACHLFAARLPAIDLASTAGGSVRLADLDRAVLFFYPRTGIPGQPPSLGYNREEWDSIPGARGCTPQSCGYRDLHDRFHTLGARVLGLSTSTSDHQREFVSRTRMPFPMLSDSELRLTRAMRLPTFRFPIESGGPDTLLARMAWFVDHGVVERVWYPVFPPDRNARDVLAWLERRAPIRIEPAAPEDEPFVRDELSRHWLSTRIYSRGKAFEADRLPAFVARDIESGRRLGLLTYAVGKDGLEVVTLSSREESRGIGAALLARAIEAGRCARCPRVFLTTSNDNLRAIGFYQRRGFTLARLLARMIDTCRERHEQSIPRCSPDGIPIRDELELEYPIAC